jgi:hypothetical protein
LFPAPLRLPTQLLDRGDEATSDVEVGEHPIFKVLSGRRNGLLPLLSVDYYYSLADDWQPSEDGSTRVIARLRNQAPLVIEKRFGDGRVISQLTKISTGNTPLGRWSNWSLNPAFPVLANEMLSHLAARSDSDQLYCIGDDMVVVAPEADFEPTIRIVLPGEGPTRPTTDVNATSGGGNLTATLDDIATSGVYHAELTARAGGVERRDFAFNVVAEGEGDLEIKNRDALSGQLAGIEFQLHDAADMDVDDERLAGFQLGDTLFCLIIGLLITEQVLAYAASFHLRR